MHGIASQASPDKALEQKLAIADSALAVRSFIAGDEVTLADIQFGHILFRYYDIGIRRANLPNVQAYYKRLAERPAFREHVMLSYDELKVD